MNIFYNKKIILYIIWILYYIKLYDIRNDLILMIGDRYSDFEAAELAETPFLFCEFGHAIPGEIPHYSAKASKVSDILNLLSKSD